ncbi:MAG: GNAT family N-acetyltransferase, partial [Anaerovoracaceae bacterium]
MIREFLGNKKEHIDLLLLADEQEDMIDFIFSYYTDCKTMLVGTGDVPSTLNFYQKCGFVKSHRIKNFFTDN